MLDGVVMEADSELEYFVQFRVAKVEANDERPHGIRYSLTLHDSHNERILGFDNAHPIEDKRKGKYSRHRKLIKWDHKHKLKDVSVVTPYDYTTAEQLLVDFWAAVDEAIRLEKPGA